jgi:glucan 1,3-beta-glucosidase
MMRFSNLAVVLGLLTSVFAQSTPPSLPALEASAQPSKYWYEEIVHNGISPFIANGTSWKVYRNVKDYGAKGDGRTDDTAAIQAAIDAGGRGPGGNGFGTTGAPAVVYFPEGTYVLTETINSYIDTFFIGNPISRPTLKVASNFNGSTFLNMFDPGFDSTTNFYIGVKNLILDSTSYSPTAPLLLMDWAVSQATQLTNILFRMPPGSQHTGVATPEGGSGTYMGNLDFEGGAIGINMNNQQYSVKSCTFTDTTTAIVISHGFAIVFQDMRFTNCQIAINATVGSEGNVGSYALIDSVAKGVQTVILTKSQTNSTTGATTGDDSVVIDNLQTSNVGKTVVAGDVTLVKGSISKTWVYGNAYLRGGAAAGVHDDGTTYQTRRAASLVSGGNYFTMAPPTYQKYSISQFVNIKNVKGFPVYGDGKTVSGSYRSWTTMLIRIIRTIRTISISFSNEMLELPSRFSHRAHTLCLTQSKSHRDLDSSEKRFRQSAQ